MRDAYGWLGALPNRGQRAGLGLIVVLSLIVAAWFVGDRPQTVVYHAKFSRVGGLKTGDPVSMAGFPVGTVKKVTLNSPPDGALVSVELFRRDLFVAEDSILSLQTVSLTGRYAARIIPGYAELPIEPGDMFVFSHDPVDPFALAARVLSERGVKGLPVDPNSEGADSLMDFGQIWGIPE